MYDIFFIIIFNYYINDDLNKKDLENYISKIHVAVNEYNKTISLIKDNTIKLKEINDIFFIIFKNELNLSNIKDFINESNIPIELDDYVSNIIMLKLYDELNIEEENSEYLIETNDDITKDYFTSNNIQFEMKNNKG
jgi:hypothetical protein